MTNPTSNFGWQMPTSTDLVTDLPADFETFGQAVDTSLADLKGGTSGQVLSKASNTDMDFTWVAADDTNAIQNAIVDAKGDLIAASAADTPARLAVGNNGETLVADSSTSTGLKWATPSAMVQLATGTMSGSGVAITSIPATYTDLILKVTNFRGSSGDKIAIRYNNNSSSNYNRTDSNVNTNTGFATTYFNATGSQNSATGNGVMNLSVYNYANTSIWKLSDYVALTNNETTSTNYNFIRESSFFNQTGAISRIDLLPESGGTWSAGTYTLYGVK